MELYLHRKQFHLHIFTSKHLKKKISTKEEELLPNLDLVETNNLSF